MQAYIKTKYPDDEVDDDAAAADDDNDDDFNIYDYVDVSDFNHDGVSLSSMIP